jgi:hypothetical protein
MDLVEIGWGVWIGFNWLRIGTGGELYLCADESSCSFSTMLASYVWF